ncbi:hypothetical protein BV20DRAFT_1055397 [Pilatotrama ljubarskyi]|nr:hypothetical protein BV20DRAFT_1055397 [Pilatotrama ljubarskyi]
MLAYTLSAAPPPERLWQPPSQPIDVSGSASEESFVHSEHIDNGFESTTHDTPPKHSNVSARHTQTRVPCCGSPADPPTVITSSAHLDTLTLCASDQALLGKHLARAHGMFACRVYPLTRLSRDPYTDEPAQVLIQRVDAFLKVAGRPVHHVEILLEWVSSSMVDEMFLVFSRRSASKTEKDDLSEDATGVCLVGTRMNAFRARICNRLITTRAEFLRNKRGMGTCTWNWDTPLRRAFDGQEYSTYAREETVVERWDEDVRVHWVGAGRTKEVDAWEGGCRVQTADAPFSEGGI